jgi:hypothetical protein
MDPELRRRYNAAYTPAIYDRVRRAMADRLSTPDFAAPLDRKPEPFRLAETPVLLSPELMARCQRAAVEVLDQLRRPEVIAEGAARIPEAFRVPDLDPEPHTLAIDFALVRGAGGEIEPKLIECQGFPSLYAMQVIQGDIWAETLATLPGLNLGWSTYWEGCDRPRYLDLLRQTIVGREDPESVVLVDIDPPAQKTRPDFIATESLLGVRSVCVTELKREGRELFAPLGDRRGPGRFARVSRIYNRVIFDELVAKGITPPFDYGTSLDVQWVPHPNWYWIWSKAAMPLLSHPAVPRSYFLSDLKRWPEDLERWVLKPLFAFAGKGVIVDVDRAALAAIPHAAQSEWMLMEKVDYAPALMTPDGHGVKVELRVLFLRPDDGFGLVPATNLCRLSRAKMHGVDYNKDFNWVGSSVAVWAG